MAGSSDIPDWTFNETGIKYDWKNPTSKTYETMFNMSPIKHIDNVLAPIFLMIGINLQTFQTAFQCILSIGNFIVGKNDLRVPPSQGIEYYHALKVVTLLQLFWYFNLSFQARGKTVKMNLYDDNHPLGKVENDVNVMINAALFFKECLDNWIPYMITS